MPPTRPLATLALPATLLSLPGMQTDGAYRIGRVRVARPGTGRPH